MQYPLTNLLLRAKASLRTRLHAVREAIRLWTSDRQVAIWIGLSVVVLLTSLLMPFDWVRDSGGNLTINIIDFFARGVVFPQLIFFGATLVGIAGRWPWLPRTGILCLSTAWYSGVLMGSTWLFFVEHVDARITTTFLELWTPERSAWILSLVATPVTPLTGQLDFRAMITSATGADNPVATVMWRNFVLATLFTYTALPRLGLLLFGILRRAFATGVQVAKQQVIGWRPRFSHPLPGSLDWFETRGDEQQAIHAFIAAGLRGREEQSAHLDALSDDWRSVLTSEQSFSDFLANEVKDRCPMAAILAFDAARFVVPGESAETPIKYSYPMSLRRALVPAAVDWFKIERALREVPALERELAKAPFSWKRWASIAGLGAAGVGAGIAVAPFLGAASIAVAGITLVKGTAATAILAAAGGGALGATTGAAVPLPRDDDPSVLVPLLARQIGLLVAGLVPRPTATALSGWIEKSLRAELAASKDRNKSACQTLVTAQKILRERGLIGPAV